ncbi:MAG: DUF6273 domain-containing protein [Bacillota bacterium]|nr:DUF6273 domain-containing protein [Bacillota bacterium]
MKLKKLIPLLISGCLVTGCSSSGSAVDSVSDFSSEKMVDESLTLDTTVDTNVDTVEEDLSSKLSEDMQRIVSGAEEQLKAMGVTDNLTLTGVYEGSYDGVIHYYQIGFFTDSHNAYLVDYYTSNYLDGSYRNSYSDGWKLSHWVNGVCGATVCPGSDNYYYSTVGEVNAAINCTRQAYQWKVIYEKEAPDYDLFRAGQNGTVVKEENNGSVTKNLDMDSFLNNSDNTIKFGKYEQDGNTDNGAEDIEWFKIPSLDGSKTLLVSKYVLSEAHGSGAKWSSSQMRKWLNNVFYKSAFSDKEKKKIISNESSSIRRKIILRDGSETIVEADSSCSDNVFILSVEEVMNNLDALERMAVGTPYCLKESNLSSGNWKDSSSEYFFTNYATRDFVESSSITYSSIENGFVYNAEEESYGIRPCVWIKNTESNKKEDSNITDPEVMYANILSQYRDAIKNNFYKEYTDGVLSDKLHSDDLNEELLLASTYDKDNFKVYYCFKDVNKNGTPELIIGAGSKGTIIKYDIFVYTNGKVRKCFAPTVFGYRTNFYMFENGNIAIGGSGGYDTYSLDFYNISKDGSEDILLDSLLTEGEIHSNTKENTVISEDQYKETIKKYTGQTTLPLKDTVVFDWTELK